MGSQNWKNAIFGIFGYFSQFFLTGNTKYDYMIKLYTNIYGFWASNMVHRETHLKKHPKMPFLGYFSIFCPFFCASNTLIFYMAIALTNTQLHTKNLKILWSLRSPKWGHKIEKMLFLAFLAIFLNFSWQETLNMITWSSFIPISMVFGPLIWTIEKCTSKNTQKCRFWGIFVLFAHFFVLQIL